jgi:hypothetical protein
LGSQIGAKPPPLPAAAATAVWEVQPAAAGALHGLSLVFGPISLHSC